MSFDNFDVSVRPLLVDCCIQYKNYPGGQFGDLARVEIEGHGKVGTVDIWAEGWVGIDVFDLAAQEQVLNLLVSPNDERCLAEKLSDLIQLFRYIC